MPPRKKYQTMYHSHCGGATKCWAMALLLPAALAEREDRADDAEGSRDQRAEIAAHVVAARPHRVLRVGQPASLRGVGQPEPGLQTAVLLVAVQTGPRHPFPAQLG